MGFLDLLVSIEVIEQKDRAERSVELPILIACHLACIVKLPMLSVFFLRILQSINSTLLDLPLEMKRLSTVTYLLFFDKTLLTSLYFSPVLL